VDAVTVNVSPGIILSVECERLISVANCCAFTVVPTDLVTLPRNGTWLAEPVASPAQVAVTVIVELPGFAPLNVAVPSVDETLVN